MSLLYLLLTLMLLFGLGLLAIPFYKKRALGRFLALSFFLSVASSSLYWISSDLQGLKQWLGGGEAHYRLQAEFNELGGLDGLITKVQVKLKENPQDAQGWMILGKLYQMKHDEVKAAAAYKKARELQR